MIDRNQLIKEEMLREYIRKALVNKDNLITEQENKLRSVIRTMIGEATEADPSKNTGINVLEELLNDIATQFKDNYKMLTSNPEERISFIKHFISFVNDILNQEKMNDEAADLAAAEMAAEVPVPDAIEDVDDAEEIEDSEGLEEEVTVAVGGEEEVEEESDEEAGMFPNVDKDKDDDSAWINIEGCNADGRARAIIAFKDVKKKILDAYSGVTGKNAELFKSYLIKNLDAYRKQAEKEIPNPDNDLANLDHTELKC
tara:strand:+ start:1060 stop:1830 length:771 start_codon:yes stop_codon:yes gene_type:complete